ncbi:DUF4430 domain-containing protein [Paenibacillus sp. GCM10023248]|uniref:DUF4430 domain-containing protein n=1 Tax=unclassified Paenibacillus TaxID=185978 RepID=UPI002379683B|nr:DUF4430 domain-containing protein [Paenibacillus sp. MAHUQ-63]MDD9271196.1 DUF4430 domain-containing protein [Paenibacillus sp. MAHUQ-63]
MKITKTTLFSAIVIVLVLVASYLFMGPPQPNHSGSLPAHTTEAPVQPESPISPQGAGSGSPAVPDRSGVQPEASTAAASAAQPATEQPMSTVKPAETAPAHTPVPDQGTAAENTGIESPKETPAPAASQSAAKQEQVIDPKSGKDQYLTEPVPSGKPLPVEPQNVTMTDKAMTATLSVTCLTILNNMKLLDKEKVELVPKDGIIFPATKVTFYEGESVFNVLQREMKKNKIHMEFVNTPIYNSAYIEGINNLYEFDAGELSGWMYKVNGWFPNYGSSRYSLKEGDVIEWVYTCDLGRDVGDTNNAMGATKQ